MLIEIQYTYITIPKSQSMYFFPAMIQLLNMHIFKLHKNDSIIDRTTPQMFLFENSEINANSHIVPADSTRSVVMG